jgi:DNA-binding NarL/FixJ family response regulator
MTALLIEPSPVLHLAGEEDVCRPQRVLIVDENELVQAGLKAVLSNESWVSACFGAGSLEMALDVARRKQPQMILVSTSVRGASGLEFCRLLRERLPLAKVVLMSSQGKVSTSLATAHGAVAFLPQHLPTAAILTVLKRVAEGAKVFPREQASEPSVSLSRRELDVLRHLVCGLSNPEVAAALNLSRHTVKQHTSVVYRKLGVRNRAQAASRAQELGLVA